MSGEKQKLPRVPCGSWLACDDGLPADTSLPDTPPSNCGSGLAREEAITFNLDFSFSFSENSQENPDTVADGQALLKSYDNISDGIWYFHLRAKENGVWGKTSHFAVKIDTSPPQNFELKTDTHSGLVYFQARDAEGITSAEKPNNQMQLLKTCNPLFSPLA